MVISDCAPRDPRLEVLGPLPPLLHGGCGLVAERGDEAAARLVYWLADDLAGVHGRAGLFGCLEARDPAAGVALLNEAASRVRVSGGRQVLGPMSGSTWGEYRLGVADGGLSEMHFTGEPPDRPDLVAIFEGAGFRPCAFYESRRTLLPANRHGAARLAKRVERSGITIRMLRVGEWPVLARPLYEFSTEAFAGNLYYRKVPFSAFMEAQDGLRRRRPLLLLAERSGVLLGIGYGYEDEVEGSRLVLKTLAVSPEARSLGLGARLADCVHDLAFSLGYSQVIHALMHVDNASVRHSERFGGVLLRRYALFRRSLF